MSSCWPYSAATFGKKGNILVSLVIIYLYAQKSNRDSNKTGFQANARILMLPPQAAAIWALRSNGNLLNKVFYAKKE